MFLYQHVLLLQEEMHSVQVVFFLAHQEHLHNVPIAMHHILHVLHGVELVVYQNLAAVQILHKLQVVLVMQTK